MADLLWFSNLLWALSVPITTPPIVWCDMSAIALTLNPLYHGRTKHFEIDFHFVREKVLQKVVTVQHIGSHDQLAGIFTKALPVPPLV